jgi:hypothetical protein
MNNPAEGRTRRDVLFPWRGRRTARVEKTDDQFQQEALRWAHKKARRRSFLQGSLLVAIASKITATAAWETLVGGYRADIGFLDGQEGRLKRGETDTLALVFGGANTRSADHQAKPIGAELAHLGAVSYVKYANNDVDIQGIADKIEKLQRKYPKLESLSVYGVSIGTQIAGGVMAELIKRGSSLKLKDLVMDSTPVDFATTDFKWIKPLTVPIYLLGGDPITTAGANTVVWGDPFEPGSTPPRTYASQGMVLRNGADYLRLLSGITASHHTRIAYLRANRPEKDTTIDPVASEDQLRRDFFPNMQTYKVSGSENAQGAPNWDHREGHANPDQNPIGYKEALRRMFKEWGII